MHTDSLCLVRYAITASSKHKRQQFSSKFDISISPRRHRWVTGKSTNGKSFPGLIAPAVSVNSVPCLCVTIDESQRLPKKRKGPLLMLPLLPVEEKGPFADVATVTGGKERALC